MSNHRYPPAYLRYLKARLLNFSKPAFWGTAIFLSVLGLVIREYWTNPDAFTYKHNSTATVNNTSDSLSEEEKAIAADIDNLPVLYNDVEKATGPITILPPKDNSKANQGKNLLQTLINQQKSAKNSALTPSVPSSNNSSLTDDNNPFITQTENLLRFGTLNNNTQLSANSSQPQGITTNSETVGVGVNQTPKTPYTSISASTSILQQPANQSLSTLNGGAVNSNNTLGQNSYNGIPQNLSNNSTTSVLGNSVGQTSYNGVQQNLSTNNQNFVPNTNPNLNNITGYIQPTVPNTSLSSYNGVNSVQSLPNQVPSTTITQPVTSSVPTNTQTYSAPPSYPVISPNQLTPPTPASYTNSNYGYFRNQIPQSSFSVPAQSTTGVQGSGYSSPNTGGVQNKPYGY
ncbi:hypothetical protein [Nostoc sp. FACHB-110]|uniref:hypothetical protein n=1 Tax=Nostoc sp. FACHB-110 TaxID=2692834 RepID=UPI001681F3A6|nr:hypothetical protein [Nostoc sp. FACHB-110]MBD2438384.1 hypothetical protein [Nostoc sp. FACHB-110]